MFNTPLGGGGRERFETYSGCGESGLFFLLYWGFKKKTLSYQSDAEQLSRKQ